MVVNTDKDPDATNPGTELFDVAGTFVTDGSDGQVQFRPSPATWADGLSEYPFRAFYEIEQTTGADVDTLIKGVVIINQQIAT